MRLVNVTERVATAGASPGAAAEAALPAPFAPPPPPPVAQGVTLAASSLDTTAW